MTNKIYIEPPESERKYRRLAKLGKELGVPVPQVFIEMEVKMPDGKVIHHHKQRSHTWNRNAYNTLFSCMAMKNGDGGAAFGGGFLNAKNTAAAVLTGSYGIGAMVTPTPTRQSLDIINATFPGLTSLAGTITKGIVVGSGVGAEDFEGFVLGTLITHGIAAGQLSYADHSVPVVSYVAGTKTLTNTIVRFMNNNSPGNVLVNEVGMIAILNTGAVQHNPDQVLVCRDKLGATVTIPATGQLKVTYVISLVYPA